MFNNKPFSRVTGLRVLALIATVVVAATSLHQIALEYEYKSSYIYKMRRVGIVVGIGENWWSRKLGSGFADVVSIRIPSRIVQPSPTYGRYLDIPIK